MIDREKLREALANELAVQRGISDGWLVTDAGAEARAKWFARADRILAIIDQHTAPQAEPAADAKPTLRDFVIDSLTERAEAAERERDEARMQAAQSTSLNSANLDRALSELRDANAAIKTLARLLAEAQR